MTEHDSLIAALERRRVSAQTVADACAAALGVLQAPAAPARGHRPKRRDITRAKTPTKRATRPKDVTRAAKPAPGQVVPRSESAIQRYIAVIVEYLRKQELRSSDGVLIRAEVAKREGVNVKKDASFPGNVSNALQTLKTTGRITRKGTMWTLTEGQ